MLVAYPPVRAAIVDRRGDGVNQHLARYEQVRAWELLPAEFTLETGEMTPTLKVKRRVIKSKYKAVIDRLYAAPGRGLMAEPGPSGWRSAPTASRR